MNQHSVNFHGSLFLPPYSCKSLQKFPQSLLYMKDMIFQHLVVLTFHVLPTFVVKNTSFWYVKSTVYYLHTSKETVEKPYQPITTSSLISSIFLKWLWILLLSLPTSDLENKIKCCLDALKSIKYARRLAQHF